LKTENRNTVFIDLPIIEQIVHDYWNHRLDTEASLDDLSTLQHWFNLISKYSELILDSSETDFFELAKSNPILKQLLKNSQTGGSKLICWKNHQVDLIEGNRFEDFPTALFLLNRDEDCCKQMTQSYGLIFLNGETYKSFTGKLFLLSDVQVKTNSDRSDITAWSDFKQLTHPMNSLILTDNFILKDQSDISANLIPLLDALMPDELSNCNFQLMIITQEMESSLFNSRYSEVKNKISLLGRNYEMEFSLITAAIGKTHDRRIFTNYGLLESNNSFTYFNAAGKVKKNTTMHLFPSFLVASGNDLMLNKNLNTLAEVKSIVENHFRQSKGPDPRINNRLFSMVTE
jgi:hypothetical protein